MKKLLAIKAITRILDDPKLHSVAIFERGLKYKVKITRSSNGNGYHLCDGPLNFAERGFVKRAKKHGWVPPRMVTEMKQHRRRSSKR